MCVERARVTSIVDSIITEINKKIGDSFRELNEEYISVHKLSALQSKPCIFLPLAILLSVIICQKWSQE